MALADDQAGQIVEWFETKFFPYVPKRVDARTAGWTEAEHKQNRLSRSLAAFAVQHLTTFNEADAAATIVDGFDDNGIDAVCFDRITNQLILVQAKFSQGKEPDLAETLKFTEGVKDLFKQRFEKFNEAFQLRLPEVLDAFEQAELTVKIVLAHLGGEPSKFVAGKIRELLAELNEYKERASEEPFNGDSIYAALTGQFNTPVIDDVVELHHWIISATTPRVLYGQISANQLAMLFEQHGRRLFAKNIRNYTGSSDVNDAIARTVREEPELLIHLNNGLTIVCKKFDPFPGALKECGRVELKSMSVVNGAQTVGSIALASRDVDLSTSPAKVQLTIIESSGATDFENRVTQARNTQNRVRPADFAAQDANQSRLWRELALSGIEYHYKPTDERTISESSRVLLEEAAFALACFSGCLEDIVTARRAPGQLSDPNNPTYSRLFSTGLTGASLYRKVNAFRLLSKIADETERASPPRSSEKMFYRHMRFFVMHFIKRRHADVLAQPDLTLSSEDVETLSRAFNELSVTIQELGQKYLTEAESGYLAVSRNLTACTQLARRVQTTLDEKGK